MNNEEVLQALDHLVGTPYTDTLKAQITEITGRVKVSGPGDTVTRELDPGRINVVTDDDGNVLSFAFA